MGATGAMDAYWHAGTWLGSDQCTNHRRQEVSPMQKACFCLHEGALLAWGREDFNGPRLAPCCRTLALSHSTRSSDLRHSSPSPTLILLAFLPCSTCEQLVLARKAKQSLQLFSLTTSNRSTGIPEQQAWEFSSLPSTELFDSAPIQRDWNVVLIARPTKEYQEKET
jgi:hypothetical protein